MHYVVHFFLFYYYLNCLFHIVIVGCKHLALNKNIWFAFALFLYAQCSCRYGNMEQITEYEINGEPTELFLFLLFFVIFVCFDVINARTPKKNPNGEESEFTECIWVIRTWFVSVLRVHGIGHCAVWNTIKTNAQYQYVYCKIVLKRRMSVIIPETHRKMVPNSNAKIPFWFCSYVSYYITFSYTIEIALQKYLAIIKKAHACSALIFCCLQNRGHWSHSRRIFIFIIFIYHIYFIFLIPIN